VAGSFVFAAHCSLHPANCHLITRSARAARWAEWLTRFPFEIDDELEFSQLFHGQLSGLRFFKNSFCTYRQLTRQSSPVKFTPY
jgi:hypothetical protein